MLVTSPKKEGQESEIRFVPLFPELRPYLLEAFERAEPGTEWVITRKRQPNVNWRTELGRIIKRAALKPWPRLFHNLRSTRQTELCDRYPAHVVCAWLGNSKPVAQEHYLQVTDAHFEAAIRDGSGPAGGPTQKATQQASAGERKNVQLRKGTSAKEREMQGVAVECSTPHNTRMTPTGFEPVLPG